jgi:uncharacterized membrane protein YeaQ/YmgE (transglycosylase-associated protein family)
MVAFLILGLLAGAVTEAASPDRQGGGWGFRFVLGVIGAIVGGWIGSLIFGGGLGDSLDLRTWLLCILGAVSAPLIVGAVSERGSRT